MVLCCSADFLGSDVLINASCIVFPNKHGRNKEAVKGEECYFLLECRQFKKAFIYDTVPEVFADAPCPSLILFAFNCLRLRDNECAVTESRLMRRTGNVVHQLKTAASPHQNSKSPDYSSHELWILIEGKDPQLWGSAKQLWEAPNSGYPCFYSSQPRHSYGA